MCNKQPFHNKLHIFNKFSVCNIYSDSHSGGVLIEFAFSIPILISILFFLCDHYRFHELKDKVKSSAYLAASMIQQLGNTRTDKQLTKDDLARISFASCLNFFHTNTMFTPWPLGIYWGMSFEWVKRVSENSYQFQHSCGTTGYGSPTSVLTMNRAFDKIKTITKAEVAAKHPDLVCSKDGDERVCVLSCYRKASGYNKHKLGFFIIDLQARKALDGTNTNFFVYPLVITPKPGLFPGKAD